MHERVQEVVTGHLRMTHKIEHLEAQVEDMEERKHPLSKFRRFHLSVLQALHERNGDVVRKLQESMAL